MTYSCIKVRFDDPVCTIQLHRPEANNTISIEMIRECQQVLDACEENKIAVVVIEGLPEVFCLGADFQSMRYEKPAEDGEVGSTTEPLYELWKSLTTGSFVVVSHVRGKVNAGGVGFVAASDIVIADRTATFSLSELLFGLYPACVLPFLIRRIGFQKANYLTLSTQTISVIQAMQWGLVDVTEENSESALRKQLLRLRRLSKDSVSSYKHYISQFYPAIADFKQKAIEENVAMHFMPGVLDGIFDYVETGKFPWEKK